MSKVSQFCCEKCKKRVDDMDEHAGWIQLGAGGRGGCWDIEFARSNGRDKKGARDVTKKQHWEAVHFCSSKCLAAYVDSL